MNAMNWYNYQQKFTEILNGTINDTPYNQKVYLEYVKLNQSRTKRWMKRSMILEETNSAIKNITTPLNWILITEPWCGDAAHSTPIIYQIAELSDMINLEIQLRDSNSEIDRYLSDGNKSIPKLIVRNENNLDLFTWGARPEACQKMVIELKEKSMSSQDKTMRIQQWYNNDRGRSIQNEIISLLKGCV
jgi:hypothetical protein